jgi:hypothetical protein
MTAATESALESRARRAALSLRLVFKKCPVNWATRQSGERVFDLIDPMTGRTIRGELTAREGLQACKRIDRSAGDLRA